MGLLPNQWLRVEDKDHGARDYSSELNISQSKTGIKPRGIWASKGEWNLSEDRKLTLLEVDYSRILVLTTKEDLLAFENTFCKKKMISYASIDATNRYYAKRASKINNAVFGNKSFSKASRKSKNTRKSKTNSKPLGMNRTNYTKKQLMCQWSINWYEVAKLYDGIALVPNPDWYFPWGEDKLESHGHTWLRSFDVSSLVIWRQSTNSIPITRAVSLGYIHHLTADAKKKKVSLDKVILEAIKNL